MVAVVRMSLAVLVVGFLTCVGLCAMTRKGKKIAILETLGWAGWDAVAVMEILTRPVKGSLDDTGLYALGEDVVGR